MQFYLRPFYNIFRQQTNFEWTTQHQTHFEELKKFLAEQILQTIPEPNQPFYAISDASNFGIESALLQAHNGTNKMNLISANSRLFAQAELRLSTLMRKCTAMICTLTEYEFFYTWTVLSNSFIYGSQTYYNSFYTKINSKP